MNDPGRGSVKHLMLPADGAFPNNPCLPLLLYPGAFLPFGNDPAGEVEARFNTNGWPAAWRNGVYSYHHYHAEAHEVLGVYRGSAKVQFGGPNGYVGQLTSGDAALLPAGTAHKLITASSLLGLNRGSTTRLKRGVKIMIAAPLSCEGRSQDAFPFFLFCIYKSRV